MTAQTPLANKAIIELRNATIGYGGVGAVREATFSVERGEALALVGPNGSGKSTIIGALAGLTDLIDGEVEVLGSPVAQLRERWRVGYVPQASSISDRGLTVWELVATGRLARLSPVRPMGKTDRGAITKALELVDLAGLERSRLEELSGGQLRRALIARTLAAEPDLLLADEPTTGVDAATRESLAQSLRTLHEDGLTIVLVSHEIGPVEEIVSRVVALRDGKIDYDGPPRPSDRVGDGEHHHHHHDDEHHLFHPDSSLTAASSTGLIK